MSNVRDAVKKIKRSGAAAGLYSIRDMADACGVSGSCIRYRILIGNIFPPKHKAGVRGKMLFWTKDEFERLKDILIEKEGE